MGIDSMPKFPKKTESQIAAEEAFKQSQRGRQGKALDKMVKRGGMAVLAGLALGEAITAEPAEAPQQELTKHEEVNTQKIPQPGEVQHHLMPDGTKVEFKVPIPKESPHESGWVMPDNPSPGGNPIDNPSPGGNPEVNPSPGGNP